MKHEKVKVAPLLVVDGRPSSCHPPPPHRKVGTSVISSAKGSALPGSTLQGLVLGRRSPTSSLSWDSPHPRQRSLWDLPHGQVSSPYEVPADRVSPPLGESE